MGTWTAPFPVRRRQLLASPNCALVRLESPFPPPDFLLTSLVPPTLGPVTRTQRTQAARPPSTTILLTPHPIQWHLFMKPLLRIQFPLPALLLQFVSLFCSKKCSGALSFADMRRSADGPVDRTQMQQLPESWHEGSSLCSWNTSSEREQGAVFA